MKTPRGLWIVASLTLLGLGCESAASMGRPSTTTNVSAKAPGLTQRATGPTRVEVLDTMKPQVFVVRGSHLGPDKLVFLHGMCGHGLGYAQSFQHASARKGTMIAPQADVVCGAGPGAKWSQDVAALDARITAGFRALGFEEPIGDICVLGMSQGATRAAALARTFPDRYTRLVSMGAPTAVETTGLSHLRAAVLMVGERERKDLMRSSEEALQRKGVPATSLVIPDADHAGMGPTPEKTMSAALDWLWSNSRPVGTSR